MGWVGWWGLVFQSLWKKDQVKHLSNPAVYKGNKLGSPEPSLGYCRGSMGDGM